MNLLTRARVAWAVLQKGESPLYSLHPELAERVPLVREFSDASGISSSSNSFGSFAQYYVAHPWVHKAVSILASNLSALPVRIATGEGNELEFINHYLNERLESPNPDQGGQDLWREWVIVMMLGGEVGLESVSNLRGNQIRELWLREPQTFTVKPGDLGRRYRQVAYYKIDDGQGPAYSLAPEQFVHFKFYNPLNPWRGLAPATAVRMSIVIDQLAQAWTRLFFKNQARPDYAVLSDEGLTPKERESIENSLAEKFGGPNAQRGPLVLDQSVKDIKVFSYPPKDLEWIEQRSMSRDEIGAIFGVPDEIMGYGRDTYENFDTADRVLWTLTILPLVRLRDGVLTRFLRKVGALKNTERVHTDTSQVAQLQEDKSKKILQTQTLFGQGVPVNVAHDFIGTGLPPVPGGDVGYLPFGLVPVGTERPDPNQDQQLGIKHFTKSTIPEYGSVQHEAAWKGLQRRLDTPVSKMKKRLAKELTRQQGEVIAAVRASKAVKDNLPSLDEVFDLEAEVKAFIEAFKLQIAQTVGAIGQAELNGLNLTIDFVFTPQVNAAIRSILDGVAKKTNDTTWNELTAVFEEANANGESTTALIERLNNYYEGRKAEWQLERTSRTTMNGAGNLGQVEAWDQSGVVSGKTWISALAPGRTRPAHEAIHGTTVGLRESFTVDNEQLDYPGDPNGEPGNIINCLCGLVAVLEE